MRAGDDTTATLVHAAKSGHHDAREELFARYLPRVVRMVAARLGVRRDQLMAAGEDMAQDAILQAMTALDRFEMRSPGAFAGWMETIVLNCVRKQFRHNHGNPERVLWQRYGDIDLHESFFAAREPTPSVIAASAEQNRQVESALLELPELYRSALVARFIGQMSHAELAQHLGRTEANCRKITQRALQMLRTALSC